MTTISDRLEAAIIKYAAALDFDQVEGFGPDSLADKAIIDGKIHYTINNWQDLLGEDLFIFDPDTDEITNEFVQFEEPEDGGPSVEKFHSLILDIEEVEDFINCEADRWESGARRRAQRLGI